MKRGDVIINALWVLTSINQGTTTDTSRCPEKYLKHSFVYVHFLHLSFYILLLENDKTFIQHGGKGRKWNSDRDSAAFW